MQGGKNIQEKAKIGKHAVILSYSLTQKKPRQSQVKEYHDLILLRYWRVCICNARSFSLYCV